MPETQAVDPHTGHQMSQGAEKFQPPEVGIEPGPQNLKANTLPRRGFYSDVVECLPVDPAAQVRFPPRAAGIFLHPVTFGGQYVGPRLGFRASLSRKCPGITAWFRVDSGTNQFKAGKYIPRSDIDVVGIGI